MSFLLSTQVLDCAALSRLLADDGAGALATFEGRVRDHHQARKVLSLSYESYDTLAQSEGAAILDQACERFGLLACQAQHRTGDLGIGEVAVWIGALAAHRDPAFAACRWVIDEIKARVPIWKHEFYADGTAEWVNCACGHSHDTWLVQASGLTRDALQNFTLIDIREPLERIGASPWVQAVPNLPMSEPEIFLGLPAARPFLLACAKGVRSRNLTLWLREQGQENFYSLDTGLDELAPLLS